MKTKAFYIPILMLLNDVMISIPKPGMLILQPELTFESIRILGFSFAGAIRLFGMPLLILVILDSIEMRRLRKSVIPLLVPIVGLLGILVFQFLAIPRDAVPTHSTGVIRYISWALGFIALLSTLNVKNSVKVHHICAATLTTLFFLLIVQYPGVIANSGYSLTTIMQAYGSDTLKLDGIFAAANEDANGAMTLLPFFLAYTEQQSGIKKSLLRIFALTITPLMILFNGTRTALFIIYPLVLFLFYSNLSIKTLLKYLPVLITLGIIIRSVGATIAQTAFSSEAQGEGTFGWRVEKVWAPAFAYGSEISPFFGFGVRGWEYVCNHAGVLNASGECESPHNIYLWLFISWGLVGLVVHLLFLLLLLLYSFRLAKFPNREIAIYAKASFCSLIAYLFWASISNANIDVAWLILILIASSVAALSIVSHAQKLQKSLSQL
ncbi:MAG: hypothetical protein KME43_00470 [Myxacorys chilensis ATA2-1-KO14]|jgi:O-antigen ligase|nr:hypothetical protein [Myxacorys chilensis ATA2-1-KO14]